MRVLLIARSFPPQPGGIENFMFNLYKHLPEQVKVVAPFVDGCEEIDRKAGIPMRRAGRCSQRLLRSKLLLLPLLFASLREMLAHDYQQIHCSHVFSGLIGVILSKLFGKPYLVFAYGMEVTGGGLKRLKSLVLRHAEKVVVISEFTRKAVRDNFGVEERKITKIMPGVDVDRFTTAVNGSHIVKRHNLDGRRIMLTVSRLAANEQYKGHDTVIRAMGKVLQEVPDCLYLIVGKGDDEERLRGLAEKCGVAREVLFAGYIPDEELPAYYAACHLFVMVSKELRDKTGLRAEGFGIVFSEASASGKPVIGGRSGGIEDAVIDGVTGLLVDPEDEEAVAQAIIRVLTDEELARRLGENGRKRVEQELTWQVAAEKLKKVIEQIEEEKKRT